MFDADDFFGLGSPVPEALRPLGLVVPPQARQIFKDGVLVWDELVELEAEYRRVGMPQQVFDDGDFGTTPVVRV
jgi:hypothetical protein